MSAIAQELQLVGMKIARDTQLTMLSAVAAGLENVKQITAAANQSGSSQGAAQPTAPLPPGVGSNLDVSA